MGGPLKLKFANHFIIYQNCPLRGHFGTGRLHSQLWDWGVNVSFTRVENPKIPEFNLSMLKVGCALSMIISSDFRMRQHRDDDH